MLPVPLHRAPEHSHAHPALISHLHESLPFLYASGVLHGLRKRPRFEEEPPVLRTYALSNI